MYIRKSTRTYKGKTYTNHLLVESVQTAEGPRQRTICSLGSREPAPVEDWLALAHKLQSALADTKPGRSAHVVTKKIVSSELLTWLVGKVSAFCLRMRGRDRITHAKLSTREQRVCLVEHVAKSFENS